MIRKIVHFGAMLSGLAMAASWIYWYIDSIQFGWRLSLAFNDYNEGIPELILFIIAFIFIVAELIWEMK